MTNKDIAQFLKISPATVSLALNDKPGVSEETKKKIIDLKNGTSLDGSEQLAKYATKGTIGLLVYKNKGDIIAEAPFFVSLIESIEKHAKRHSYNLNIIFFSEMRTIDYIDELNEAELTGLIIVATEMNEVEASLFREHLKKPFIMLDACLPGCSVDTVLMDNVSGIIQAFDHAIAMGHTRIGFIRSSMQCNNFADRFQAFKNRAEQIGIFEEKYVFEVPPYIEGSSGKMKEILRKKLELPTLFIASNDKIAIGALEALKSVGFVVPEISMIGFDDMPATQFLNPPLTSVRLFPEEIARLAINHLVGKISNPKRKSCTIQQLVEVQLVERCSVKNLNS